MRAKNISSACNGRSKSAYGYQWEFEDPDLVGKHHRDMPKYKKRKMKELLEKQK